MYRLLCNINNLTVFKAAAASPPAMQNRYIHLRFSEPVPLYNLQLTLILIFKRPSGCTLNRALCMIRTLVSPKPLMLVVSEVVKCSVILTLVQYLLRSFCLLDVQTHKIICSLANGKAGIKQLRMKSLCEVFKTYCIRCESFKCSTAHARTNKIVKRLRYYKILFSFLYSFNVLP